MRKFISVILAVIMIISAMPFTVSAESGNCGANVKWTLDSNGILTISGTGSMDDYILSSATPWNKKLKSIKKIIIGEGVTNVGDNAFSGCSILEEVVMPEGLLRIGAQAFMSCSKLVKADIPSTVTEIKWSAFTNCVVLEKIVIPEGVTNIERNTFYNCRSLGSIIICNPECTIYDSDAIDSDVTICGYCGSTAQGYAKKYNRNFEIYQHSYEAVLTTAPTCTEKGFITYTCECGDSYVDETDALGHDFSVSTFCGRCGYALGDVNGDNCVDSNDAIHLLYYTLIPERYEINQDCDFDKDGTINSNDAIYILYHVLIPDRYPL